LKKIIISRTDSIGDVILTLPMAGVLKKYFPGCQIIFIGKKYTRPIIEACEHVDRFIDWDEISGSQQAADSSHQSAKLSLRAKRSNSIQYLQKIGADAILHVFPVKEICKVAQEAGIPLRIATSHRWYSWLYCNKLLHFSRKNSNLHEAQLNLKMLEPLGINQDFLLKDIPNYYGLSKLTISPFHHFTISPFHHITTSPHHHITISPDLFNLILHPKSKGSAREWGLENYSRLIGLLPEEKFRIFITGTKEEALLMKDFLLQHHDRVTDLTGKLTLAELIRFINQCDGIVAASTGPLHIAAALGKYAFGLYAPMKPIFPKRWAPLGVNADYLVLDKKCNDCRRTMDCNCIRSIKPEDVAGKIKSVVND
jgi:heptosyltransferase III